jgi:hypothetical protein
MASNLQRLIFLPPLFLLAAGCRPTPPVAPLMDVTIATADALPVDPDDAIWKRAPEFIAPLLPQDQVEPRQMHVSTSEVRVRAVAAGDRVAFRLQWTDPTLDDQPGQADFTDACAVQLPARVEPTLPAPQMGEPGRIRGDHLLDRGLASHRRWTRRYAPRSLSERNRRSLSARRGTVESRPHGATRVRNPLLAGPSLGEHHGRTARAARAGLDRRRAGHAKPRAVERFPRPRPARRRRLDRRGQPAVARWLDARPRLASRLCRLARRPRRSRRPQNAYPLDQPRPETLTTHDLVERQFIRPLIPKNPNSVNMAKCGRRSGSVAGACPVMPFVRPGSQVPRERT